MSCSCCGSRKSWMRLSSMALRLWRKTNSLLGVAWFGVSAV